MTPHLYRVVLYLFTDRQNISIHYDVVFMNINGHDIITLLVFIYYRNQDRLEYTEVYFLALWLKNYYVLNYPSSCCNERTCPLTDSCQLHMYTFNDVIENLLSH